MADRDSIALTFIARPDSVSQNLSGGEVGRALHLEWCLVSRDISAPLLSTGHSTLAFNDVHCVSILKEISGQQAEVNLLSRCRRECGSESHVSVPEQRYDHTLSSRQIPESLCVTFLDVYKVCLWTNRQSIGVRIDGVGCAMYV